jgi:hypothetical protein
MIQNKQRNNERRFEANFKQYLRHQLKEIQPENKRSKNFGKKHKNLAPIQRCNAYNDINSKSPLLNKNNSANANAESQNTGTRIALSELISMQKKKEEDKSSKVKNPFEWFEESIQKKLRKTTNT